MGPQYCLCWSKSVVAEIDALQRGKAAEVGYQSFCIRFFDVDGTKIQVLQPGEACDMLAEQF